MDSKVDIEMLNEVKLDKASRDELKEAMFLMNDMNQRMKQIAILQKEIASSL
jgi:hypothetical protein